MKKWLRYRSVSKFVWPYYQAKHTHSALEDSEAPPNSTHIHIHILAKLDCLLKLFWGKYVAESVAVHGYDFEQGSAIVIVTCILSCLHRHNTAHIHDVMVSNSPINWPNLHFYRRAYLPPPPPPQRDNSNLNWSKTARIEQPDTTSIAFLCRLISRTLAARHAEPATPVHCSVHCDSLVKLARFFAILPISSIAKQLDPLITPAQLTVLAVCMAYTWNDITFLNMSVMTNWRSSWWTCH